MLCLKTTKLKGMGESAGKSINGGEQCMGTDCWAGMDLVLPDLSLATGLSSHRSWYVIASATWNSFSKSCLKTRSEDINVCFPQPRNKLGGQDRKTTHQILTGPFGSGSESLRSKVLPRLFMNPQHRALRGAPHLLCREDRLHSFSFYPESDGDPNSGWRPCNGDSFCSTFLL